MKYLFSIILVIGLVGCAPAQITDPATRKVYTANEVLKRVGEFQNAVIDASDSNKIKVSDARTIVTWISGDNTTTPPKVGIVTVIASAKDGWRHIVNQSWIIVRPVVLANPILNSWIPILDSLLAEVQ